MKIGQKSMKIHNPKTPDLKIPNPTKIRRKFKRKSAKINENPEKSRKIPDPNKSEIRKSQQIRRKSANKISGWVKSDENLPLWVEFQVAPPGAAVARAGGAWKMEVSPGCCYCCTREARCVFQNTLPNKCKWWQQNSRNDPRARRASNKLRRGTTFRNVSINTHWRTIRGQKKGVICWETPCFVGAASHSWPADQRVVAHPLKSRSCTMVIWARFFWAFFLEFEAVVDQNQTLVAPLKHLFPP